MKSFFSRYTPLQIAIHIYGWSALVRLIVDFYFHHLTANLIQAMEQRTGRHSLTLLVLSLLCTPLSNFFAWRALLKRRRALGLYAFMRSSIQLIIFMHLAYGFAWSFLLHTVTQQRYIIYCLCPF